MAKIALYYPYIHLRSGIERTILEILKRSRHEWTVFTNLFQQETTFPELGVFANRIIELDRVSVKRSYLSTLKSAFTIFNQKLPLEGFDLLWVHNEGLGSFINFRNRSLPSICFCHTPMKVVYDPDTRKSYLLKHLYKLPFFLVFSALFKLIDKKAFSLYRWCFCVSDEVRHRLLRNSLFPDKKITVVYRGVDTRLFPEDVEYGNYFLLPARIKWWKNIELSIESFMLLQAEHRELSGFKLIISGEVYDTNRPYYKKIRKLASKNQNIVFVDNPSEQQLLDLYKNCRAVLSTTLNEDFGLTVIESFACAKPVVAINKGGPKEVIRHGQEGFLSHPCARQYCRYLCELAKDRELAERMGKTARESSLKYDWSAFIEYMDRFLDDFSKKQAG